ncbi:MAG: helix-turn-helix domain-containing protein [Eubacteriales bacterium]|jgi:transcriptional regulator with XRE-family HTH domain|nr:helix-turn-helix domain-containing protein [Lachnospiraceae bacterium]MDD5859279.1 helix-turn-helix domain-containing protein [Eubacteriales bacterium]MCI1309824.1 helix-turn-helix domain-containing protein [Lachnospiraceae bacterium]MCI1334253.1 helix-turn-helix domain-containing protein [Lachnospiraceae bacterium]MCI1358455.1 helix-turn-helix domain-containing protein [Lachnospiraceae bacterium]
MAVLLPGQKRIMEKVGEQIRMARLRRKLPVEMVAERADISRATLWKIEKGDPSVAIGSYLKVLNALGLQKDMEKLAADDVLGRTLQDLGMETKIYKKK